MDLIELDEHAPDFTLPNAGGAAYNDSEAFVADLGDVVAKLADQSA